MPVLMNRHIIFPVLELLTPAGPYRLLRFNVWIDESDPDTNLTVGLPVMREMGYTTMGLIQSAQVVSSTLDLRHLSVTDQGDTSAVHKALRLRTLRKQTEEREFEGVEDMDDDDDDGDISPETADMAVTEALKAAVASADAEGISPEGKAQLGQLLLIRFHDVFRKYWKTGDVAVKVAPLKVQLRDGATPAVCKQRRYSPLHAEFIRKHTAEIVKYGLGWVNPRSRWASPPRVVNKKDMTLRMTVDQRGPNSMTEPMHWPMPVLEVVMSRLEGKKYFFAFDWFKGYWQLPLHPESQEIFTIMGIDEMITPNRVSMGQSDAVAYCQSVAQEIYGDRYGKGIEAWLDDGLGSAISEKELLELLAWVLERCESYGLKLNPSKCEFFTKSVIWCGKKISADGITHDPKRIQGLLDMPAPVTGQDLQQWVCALNWMRQSLPKFNELIVVLDDLLQSVCKKAGSNKSSQLAKHLLADYGWGITHDTSFAATKDALRQMVTLAHPDPD